MKVSVLVCVHSTDHENDRLLQRAIESLVSQDYAYFETIFVLDECHEFTRDIIEHYKEVLDLKIYERVRKQGLAFAKNFGINKCNGDWIAYLDADDAWAPDKLRKQVNFVLNNPEYSVIGTQAWDVYSPLEDSIIEDNCFEIGQYQTYEQIIAELPHQNVMCHGSVLIKKDALLSVGGYSETRDAIGQEDWLLWKKLAAEGHKFYNIPERLYYYSMGTSVER